MQAQASELPSVLIIDDDVAICNVIGDILQFEGAHVFKAHTGLDGIEQFREQQNRIRLVLLDLQLPDIFGLEVYKQLKGYDPTVSVVVVTGKYQPGQHFDQGIRILAKPFSMVDLLTIVKEVL